MVCSARDESAGGCKVAIKKIEGVFECVQYAMCVVRELRILGHLQHESIVSLQDCFFAGAREGFDYIYLVFPGAEADLWSVLRSGHDLYNDHAMLLTYQLCRALKYVHSAGVVHRDVKPRNLLVSSDCDLRLCDFGLARLSSQTPALFASCAR